MRFRLVGANFTNHLCIGDLLFPIHRDVIVANNCKCVHPSDALVLWSISDLAYPLAQSAQFVGVIFLPNILVLEKFPQFCVLKGLSHLFIKHRHCQVKDKFARLPSTWGVHRENEIRSVRVCTLCNGIRGHWEWLGLMWTCTLDNRFRHSCLMGLICFHPWIWCKHPWSWCRYPWEVPPWRTYSRCWLGHPGRWWSQGYASFWCRGYASFAPVSAVLNFWRGSWRHCGKLVQVGPSLEEIPEFYDCS